MKTADAGKKDQLYLLPLYFHCGLRLDETPLSEYKIGQREFPQGQIEM